MVNYYTLEEAARILQTTPDKLRDMANRKEIRAFQDRGTLRFRAQEINELARAQGLGSDPELQPREAPPAKGAGGKPTVHVPQERIDLNLEDDSDEEVPLGREKAKGSSSGSGSSSPVSPRPGGAKSPPPKPGSDSDVRLVLDSSDLDFQIDAGGSSVRGAGSKSGGPKSPAPKSGGPKSPAPKSGPGPAGEAADSGVRIVPLDQPSDSDVKMVPTGPPGAKGPSDSDIRLEEQTGSGVRKPRRTEESHVTEEIDLDAEAQKAEAGQPKARPGKAGPPLPTSSPFELSSTDLSHDKPRAKGAEGKKEGKKPEEKKGETDSSSDFELTPYDSSQSPLDVGSSEEVSLGGETGRSPGSSGINLQSPADSGISLEPGSSEEVEFELSLDAGASSGSTPKPVQKKEDSSSEFELSLDAGSSPSEEASDSEFELSLDADAGDPSLQKVEEGSSSEFELTLDESGSLAVEGSGENKDIFEETNFEVPSLEDESGSEAVALDDSTAEEASDFELSLDADQAGKESGSQVVALEGDEEADAGAATVARPRKAARPKAAVAEEEEAGELEAEPREEPAEEEEAYAPAAAAPPAEWGPVPAIALFPAVILLFLVGIMGFELVHGLWGYHKGNKVTTPLTHSIARIFDDSLPKE
jgi:excisionase family DNA binding protein